jgi:hypothetical protein
MMIATPLSDHKELSGQISTHFLSCKHHGTVSSLKIFFMSCLPGSASPPPDTTLLFFKFLDFYIPEKLAERYRILSPSISFSTDAVSP